MNKADNMSAVLKFINGPNNNIDYFKGVYEYVTDPVKTDKGTLVATHGCSEKNPLRDIMLTKKLFNKKGGKQGEHFVLSFPPNASGKSPIEILRTVSEIVETVFPEYQSITAVHTDSKLLHTHTILNSVNAVTGKKFSQSPLDLNRLKQKVNNMLSKQGFEIIKTSANDFVDNSNHSESTGYDYLELDESDIFSTVLTTQDTTSVVICNDDFHNNFYGGYNMANSYNNKISSMVNQHETMHTTRPAFYTSNNVATHNNYPSTTIVTGPTIRVHGNSTTDLSPLCDVINQNSGYANKHINETANLALQMQEYSQTNGFPTNISIIAGPVFDIDLSDDEK